MARQLYKRRHILIDPFQYRLLFINILYFVIILLVFAGALFLPLIFQLDSDSRSVAEQGRVAGELLSLHVRVWPAIFITLVLLTIHSIFVVHKIVGPLFRLRSVFRSVAEGDLSVQANFRRGDYPIEEVDVLNDMIATLRRKIKCIQEPCKDLRAAVRALERAIESESVEVMSQTFEDFRGQMSRLKMAMDQFRIDPDETSGENQLAITVSTPTSEGHVVTYPSQMIHFES